MVISLSRSNRHQGPAGPRSYVRFPTSKSMLPTLAVAAWTADCSLAKEPAVRPTVRPQSATNQNASNDRGLTFNLKAPWTRSASSSRASCRTSAALNSSSHRRTASLPSAPRSGKGSARETWGHRRGFLGEDALERLVNQIERNELRKATLRCVHVLA